MSISSYLATSDGLGTNQGGHAAGQGAQKDTIQISYCEVWEIIKSDKPEDVGKIRYRAEDEGKFKSDDSYNVAYPINSQMIVYPLLHEWVQIITLGDKKYWIGPVSRDARIHNNAKIEPIVDFQSNDKQTNIKESKSSPVPKKINESSKYKLSTIFNMSDLKNKVATLKIKDGDSVFRGRFGNSIRMSSGDKLLTGNIKLTVTNTNSDYIKSTEKIDTDNVIWITTDEILKFSPIGIPISKKNSPPTMYDGNQILLCSDRIIFGTKKNELIFLSNTSILNSCKTIYGVDSDNLVNIKSGKEINLSSKKIHLGEKAEQPLVLGHELVNILTSILTYLANDIHVTPAGQSVGSKFAKQYGALSAKLKTILSKVSYTE